MNPDITILKGDYSIYRLKRDSPVPDWAYDSEFYSLTVTQEELSIVCRHAEIKKDENLKIDKHWRIIKINGPLDLAVIGIIANISSLFKENSIAIFVVSTYDTDYILVKNQDLDKALAVLKNNGYKLFIEK